MKKSKTRARISAEPNLTPILDMVFQLITFFMLVISFKVASLDPGVRLPVLGNARPSSQGTENAFVVLNIDAAGSLRVYGEVSDLDQYLSHEAAVIREKLAGTNGLENNEELAATALIRADRATPFRELNRVLMACKKHGYRNVTLKVLDAQIDQNGLDTTL